MDFVFFIRELKKELRRSRVTYKDLGRSLNLTEAGVKKLLNKSDLSLGRANLICKAIGVSIQDMIQASEEAALKSQKFTEPQIQFFLQNPDCFGFYMQLAYEQKNLEEINTRTLGSATVFRFLKKLDELGLIRLMPGNKVQFPEGKVGIISTKGTPLEKIKNEMSVQFLKKVIQEKEGTVFGGTYYLSPEERESLMSELKELQMKYAKRSLANRGLKRPKSSEIYSTTTHIVAMGPFSLFEATLANTGRK